MEPTRSFAPFGTAGPKILLFGKNTGDWNLAHLQLEGDHRKVPGLYSRISQVSLRYQTGKIFAPIPTNCNTIVRNPYDFTAEALIARGWRWWDSEQTLLLATIEDFRRIRDGVRLAGRPVLQVPAIPRRAQTQQRHPCRW